MSLTVKAESLRAELNAMDREIDELRKELEDLSVPQGELADHTDDTFQALAEYKDCLNAVDPDSYAHEEERRESKAYVDAVERYGDECSEPYFDVHEYISQIEMGEELDHPHDVPMDVLNECLRLREEMFEAQRTWRDANEALPCHREEIRWYEANRRWEELVREHERIIKQKVEEYWGAAKQRSGLEDQLDQIEDKLRTKRGRYARMQQQYDEACGESERSVEQ